MRVILFGHVSNTLAEGVSLGNPLLCLYAIYSVLLSLASSTSCFHRLPVTDSDMPPENESTEAAGEASGQVTGQSIPSPGNPELVQ